MAAEEEGKDVSYQLMPLGDHGMRIELGSTISPDTRKKAAAVASLLDEAAFPWLIEYIPAFTTVTVLYDIILAASDGESPVKRVCRELSLLLDGMEVSGDTEARIVEIPVCYGGEAGPDLNYVASCNGMSPDDVIRIHQEGVYSVHMIGFAPGFPYIGGMPAAIAAPRRTSPRLKIPAGSVGIAGEQTGVYPIETPGGWQLIGRTPLALFRPDEEEPSLLRAGDRIVFKAITYQEFIEWEGRAHAEDS